MILQALARYYDCLAARGEIVPEGWSSAKVAFALELNGAGEIIGLFRQEKPEQRGEKTVMVPRVLPVPAQVKRTVGVAANFLCDTAAYLLGVDSKGNPARARKCFDASAARHLSLLDGVDSPAAQAVRAFYEGWQPENASAHPVLAEQWETLTAGGNLVFLMDGGFAHEDKAIRQAWENARQRETDEPLGRCLVTGENAPIARLHGSIKGVRDAQSSGASLVSFNAPAFESYGKTQSFNAPVSERAAFAYTTALNHLLADREHTVQLGDTTVVCWAESAEPVYQDVMLSFTDERAPLATELHGLLHRLELGQPPVFGSVPLDTDEPFYVLGLSPSAARLSVRFFYRQSFGALLKHMTEHLERTEIVRPSYDTRETLSVWSLLGETVRDKKDRPSPVLAGAVMRAVLTGGRYPAALLNGAMLRIRAEQKVTRGRAAIIKAYYQKNGAHNAPEEVFDVELNRETEYMPYLLGRLFALMEQIQKASSDGPINTTIRDRFLKSASTMPHQAFATLFPLSEKHMEKLERTKVGLAYLFAEEKKQICNLMHTDIPKLLAQADQCIFYQGYYKQLCHQYTSEKTEKKED